VQVAEGGGGEPAAPGPTVEEVVADAEKDFFDFISKERRRLARESNVLKVSSLAQENKIYTVYKKCAFLFLSELRQISINCNKFW